MPAITVPKPYTLLFPVEEGKLNQTEAFFVKMQVDDFVGPSSGHIIGYKRNYHNDLYAKHEEERQDEWSHDVELSSQVNWEITWFSGEVQRVNLVFLMEEHSKCHHLPEEKIIRGRAPFKYERHPKPNKVYVMPLTAKGDLVTRIEQMESVVPLALDAASFSWTHVVKESEGKHYCINGSLEQIKKWAKTNCGHPNQ